MKDIEKLEELRKLDKTIKQKVEIFRELDDFFKDKAEKIALLKNKYSEFTPVSYDYIENPNYNSDDNEWEVVFVERSRCGCSNEENTIYISEEEILSDLDDIEEKLKIQYEIKMQEKEKIKKDKEDKIELDLYNQLKTKYEPK
jgi:hypothetical protein